MSSSLESLIDSQVQTYSFVKKVTVVLGYEIGLKFIRWYEGPRFLTGIKLCMDAIRAFTTVKLGYNEHSVITNTFCCPNGHFAT